LCLLFHDLLINIGHYIISRLTGSESEGQEEAACACPSDATTGVLFTATNAVKFPSTVTWLSWALPLSYYRASTFLPWISKPKMNKLGATVVKNQPFRLLWCPFPYLRLKLGHLESNSIVTRENNTFVLCRISKPTFITIHSTTLLCSLQYSDLRLIWLVVVFLINYFYFCNLCVPQYFSRNEADNLWVHFHHLITCMFCLQFWWNFYLYFYSVYPTSRPKN